MIHLLLSTLEMVVLTFVIGFFVAGVIKFIAIWADSMDFYSSHQDVHQKVARLVEQEAMKNYKFYGDRRGEFSRGINEDPADVRKAGYYHGVSHGASKMDLLDYYYPEDTQLMYFKKHEQYKEEQEGGLNKRNDTSKEDNR